MVPDDSEFGFGGDVRFTDAERWLGAPSDDAGTAGELVKRYLAAFGPATPADFQNWSGLPKSKPVFEKLRPRLVVLSDEKGRDLYDVPDGLRPSEDTPAPVRFLPGFDTAVLGHEDRSRIISDEDRPRLTTKNLQVLPAILIDGFVAGTWEMGEKKNSARITIRPFRRIPARIKPELVAEGERLLRFAVPDASRLEIHFLP
jgi:hypothetical protein